MDAINFCYWLQGYFEMNPDALLSAEQVKMIRQHLKLVFESRIQGPSKARIPQQADLIGQSVVNPFDDRGARIC